MKKDASEKQAGEWPFATIPETWCWATFERVFDNVTNSDRKVPQQRYCSTGKHAVVDQGTSFVGGYTDDDSLLHPLKPPFVVFGDHTRCVKYVPFPFVQGADGIKVLKPNQIDSKYAYWMLKAIQLPNRGYSRHFQFLRNSSFPIAPFSEQRRVVAKIEELFSDLDAGVAALERVRANLKRYRAAVLKAAVEGKLTESWRAQHPNTEPASVLSRSRSLNTVRRSTKSRFDGQPEESRSNLVLEASICAETAEGQLLFGCPLPPSWSVVHVSQVAEMCLGKMLDKRKHTSGRLYPYLRNLNVRWGKFALQDVLEMFFEDHEIERFALKNGDLLVCEGGEPGRAAVWRNQSSCMKFQKALHRVRCHEVYLPELLQYYLEHLAKTKLLERFFTGSTIKHFTGESFAKLPIPLPPLDEQRGIVEEIERRLSIADELERSVISQLKRANRLRQGILKRAFEGRLVPHDPNDEPASHLLQRIGAEALHSVKPKRRIQTSDRG